MENIETKQQQYSVQANKFNEARNYFLRLAQNDNSVVPEDFNAKAKELLDAIKEQFMIKAGIDQTKVKSVSFSEEGIYIQYNDEKESDFLKFGPNDKEEPPAVFASTVEHLKKAIDEKNIENINSDCKCIKLILDSENFGFIIMSNGHKPSEAAAYAALPTLDFHEQLLKGEKQGEKQGEELG